MGKTYCLFSQAADTLAVSPEYLARRIRGKNLVVASPEAPNVPLVCLADVATLLRIPQEVLENVLNGREWLMSATQIEKVYGLRREHTNIVTGGPVLRADEEEVHVTMPVILFLALDPREQRMRLEGYSHGKVQNKRIRSQARVSR